MFSKMMKRRIRAMIALLVVFMSATGVAAVTRATTAPGATLQAEGKPLAQDGLTIEPVGHFGGWLASVTVPPSGGQTIYVGTGTGLTVLDVSDPSASRQVGSLPVGESDVISMSIVGGMACVISGRYLITVDLTTPTKPTLVQSTILDSGASARNVEWVGSYAYVAASASDWSNGLLQVYDVSNPSNPTFLTSVETL